jgi:hypothetical protein
MGRLAKWFIDSGMRKGTPRELHENVITVYGGTGDWKKWLKVAKGNEDAAFLILLDPDGRVQWLHAGPFERPAFEALQAAVSRLLRQSGGLSPDGGEGWPDADCIRSPAPAAPYVRSGRVAVRDQASPDDLRQCKIPRLA